MPHTDTPEAPGSLLAPELAVRTGALIGYARVSTSGQLLDRQQHALAEADCIRVFADKLSGKNSDRPELAACLDYLRPGEVLRSDAGSLLLRMAVLKDRGEGSCIRSAPPSRLVRSARPDPARAMCSSLAPR